MKKISYLHLLFFTHAFYSSVEEDTSTTKIINNTPETVSCSIRRNIHKKESDTTHATPDIIGNRVLSFMLSPGESIPIPTYIADQMQCDYPASSSHLFTLQHNPTMKQIIIHKDSITR